MPVDAEKLNVHEPHKLESKDYASAEEFEPDIRLMFDNCYKFNVLVNNLIKSRKTKSTIFSSQIRKNQDQKLATTKKNGETLIPEKGGYGLEIEPINC
ncbi:5607_t:CDS:2 [Entrophospora sp. SA101]|nr:5607_t:CDS:2 [Entrophospora sp. SA101]